MFALCLPRGPGYITARGPDLNWAMTKVIQTPGLIVILSPDLTYRQIFLDGRALEPDANPSWMGYSVGHWEGDTLVVESASFNDRTWLDGGYPHTEGLRTVERYRRSDFGHLAIEVELHDPALYAAPWTATVAAQFAADTELLEYVCNENHDVSRALGRHAFRRAAVRSRDSNRYFSRSTPVPTRSSDRSGKARPLRECSRSGSPIARCFSGRPGSCRSRRPSSSIVGSRSSSSETARARQLTSSTSTCRAITDSTA